jgi:hypothetical protein
MQRNGFKFAPTDAEDAAAQHLMVKHLSAFAAHCKGKGA